MRHGGGGHHTPTRFRPASFLLFPLVGRTAGVPCTHQHHHDSRNLSFPPPPSHPIPTPPPEVQSVSACSSDPQPMLSIHFTCLTLCVYSSTKSTNNKYFVRKLRNQKKYGGNKPAKKNTSSYLLECTRRTWHDWKAPNFSSFVEAKGSTGPTDNQTASSREKQRQRAAVVLQMFSAPTAAR